MSEDIDGCDSILSDGGPVCGAAFRQQSLGEQMRCEYRCERGHLKSEQYLALHQLGPYAPKRSTAVEHLPIPGFRWSEADQCYLNTRTKREIEREVADDMRRWHAKGRPGW